MFSHATLNICRIFILSIMFYATFLSVAPCFAETKYISDVLVITLRKDQSLESEIIGYLKSAEPVTVISETDTLAKIENKEGLVGWIRKKFLVPGPPKKLIIDKLQRENDALKNKLNTLSTSQSENGTPAEQVGAAHLKQIAQLKENAIQSKALMAEADKELANLVEEIANLRAKNKKIANQLQNVAKIKPDSSAESPLPPAADGNIKKIRSDGFTWPDRENIIWLLIGGGIMLLGFVVGFFSRRKKAYYY